MIFFYGAIGIIFIIGIFIGYFIGYTQAPEKIVMTHDVPTNWPDAYECELVREIQRLRLKGMYVQADKMKKILIDRGCRVDYRANGDIWLWQWEKDAPFRVRTIYEAPAKGRT